MRTVGAVRVETSVYLEPSDHPFYLTNEDGNRFRVRQVSFSLGASKASARGTAIKVDGTEGCIDRTARNVKLEDLPREVLAGLLRSVEQLK